MNKWDRNIVENAIETFRQTTGMKAEFQPERGNGALNPDSKVCIGFKQHKQFFFVEVKRKITQATAMLERITNLNRPEKTLIITEYATPPVAEMLKEADTPFLDTVGNAYLNEPPVYVFIKGNKLEKGIKTEQTTRLFKPCGLKVVFALLNNPDSVNQPYRDIAEATGVALGTVGWVMNDLKERRFVQEIGERRRKLLNFENLLKRWVEAYPEQLRPKLVRERFKADTLQWWKEVNIKAYGARWGGEVAAALLTGYLKPEKITIYSPEPLGRFVLKHRLRKANDGEVEILEPFWPFEDELNDRDVVPPLLIYADLLATGDARNIETAGMIYGNHLVRPH